MTPPATSIVVVSRHRLANLRRCLCALSQQDHPRIEVIVVADPESCAALSLLADRIKLIPFDEANISAARNLGLAAAAGEVVAYIDDDAVAEPTWAYRLSTPFADPRVGVATGFVRGRNGISFQWKAAIVTAEGTDRPLAVDPHAISLHAGTAAEAVKTQGTNMAFRRRPLLAAGGFDPALHFYLDEAHVDLTLAAEGHLCAVVPCAQVHHGFAASPRRRADRAPLDLHEIGASSAVFLRRHAPDADPAPALDRLRADQRARLLRYMVDGRIAPGDVRRLMRGLETGIAEGTTRTLTALNPLRSNESPFLALPGTVPRPGVVMAGYPWSRGHLRRAAASAVEDGAVVTVIRLGLGMRAHRVRFTSDGVWEQSGGLFGRSERSASRLVWMRFADRVRRETARIREFRPARNPAEG